MSTARESQFSMIETSGGGTSPARDCVLPGQHLRELIEAGRGICSSQPIEAGQIQPASLDLRLGKRAFRVRASFLPGDKATVRQKIDQFAMHEFKLGDEGTVLEKGCVYIVELIESLALGPDLSALANPKSSIGRIDVFTRLITDYGMEFDRVRADYQGPLYAEISPRTFSILAREGDRLNQIRLKRRAGRPGAAAVTEEQTENGQKGVPVTVSLEGTAESDGVIGYRARKHAG
ncbi:MAG: 2'-deoxycytidine 5'-triphosphate deaminase domain-containing protein, partial [Geminicoccaceae bacterium]